MATVPIYTPQVAQRALPTPTSSVRPADTQLAEGLQQLGQGVSQLGQAYAQAQQKANALAVVKAKSLLREDIDREELGILNEHGERAMGAAYQVGPDGADASNYRFRLAKRREQIAHDNLFNEEQRQAFGLETDDMLSDVQRRVESHIARENWAALGETAKAKQEEAARHISKAMELNPDDLETVAKEIKTAEEDLRKLAPTDEVGNAWVNTWRGNAARVALDMMISKQDLARAQAFLAFPVSTATDGKTQSVSDVLGPQLANYQERLKRMEEPVEINMRRSAILDAAKRQGTNRLDADEAMRLANEIPNSKPWKAQLITQIKADISDSRQRGREEALENFDRALVVLWRRGSLTSPEMAPFRDWLTNEVNSDTEGGALWNRLVEQHRHDMLAERSTRAAEKNQQKEIDEYAFKTYMGFSTQQRADLNVNDLLVGRGVSRLGIAAIAAQQVKDKEAALKAVTPDEREFISRVETSANSLDALKGKAPDRLQRRVDFKSAMQTWYFNYTLKHPGQRPSAQEISDVITENLTLYVKPRFILPNTRKFLFEINKAELPEWQRAPAQEQEYQPSAATPAEARKLWIVGPAGQRAVGTDGPELDAWLKAHEGWRREEKD